MDAADLEMNLSDLIEAKRLLVNMWSEQDRSTIGSLLDEIFALAPRHVPVEESGDVSPLVYMMF